MGRVEDALRRAAGPTADRNDAGSPTDAEAFPTEAADTATAVAEPAEPEVDLPLVTEAVGGEAVPASDSPDTAPAAEAAPAAETAGTQASRLVGSDAMLAVSREQYRRLAASLHHMQTMSGLKVILIASALAGEGKTLTASNLALTFSESYDRNVLLIDADLRRPSLARTFGIEASPGLSDGLGRGFEGKLAPQQLSDRLMVLPAGRPMVDPMAGLTSVWMQRLIAEAREAFDWVIIDTPPIGLMTDANLLAAMADGVVLVVKANATPYQMVKRAVDAIGKERLLGTVLNRATAASAGDGYYYYGYRNYARTYGNQAAGR